MFRKKFVMVLLVAQCSY